MDRGHLSGYFTGVACKNLSAVEEILFRTFERHIIGDRLQKGFADDVDGFLSYSLSVQNRRKSRAGFSLENHLEVIFNAQGKHIYTVAAKAEYKVIGQAKAFEIHSISKKKEPPGRDGALTKKQFAELLKSAESIPFMHQFIRFSANTGLRRGRIFRLTWSMIVEGNDGQLYINIPRDKHGDRHDAPLNDEAMKVIRERDKARQDDIPYVFYRDSTRTILGDVKKEWIAITKQAGLSWYHLHDLRHTFVSHSIMSGIDIKTTQQLSGHKTNSMVSRYAHLSQDHQMHEVKKLSYEIQPEPPTQEQESALDSACL